MKNLYILFILLQTAVCYTQNASKRAYYKIKFINLDNPIVKKAAEQQDLLEFFLDFNTTNSQFYIQDTMPLPNSGINMASAYSKTPNTIFTDLNSKKIITQPKAATLVSDKEFLVVDKIPNDWTILNESKLIDGFLCYKATRKVTTGRENKREYEQIGWFSPQIPYAFGPHYALGLPGLVLEFQDDKSFFYLQKIVNLNQKFKFKIPKKGKVLSKKAFNDTIFERRILRKQLLPKIKK